MARRRPEYVDLQVSSRLRHEILTKNSGLSKSELRAQRNKEKKAPTDSSESQTVLEQGIPSSLRSDTPRI